MNSETAPLFFSLIALFFINLVYDGCFLFSYSFVHPFHKYMLRTYCVLSTLGSTVGKAEGKILLYLALSNTEVIPKANSRMGTVLAAVLLPWETGEHSSSYRRSKRSVVGLLIVSGDSSRWEANRPVIGAIAENFPSWSVGNRYRGGHRLSWDFESAKLSPSDTPASQSRSHLLQQGHISESFPTVCGGSLWLEVDVLEVGTANQFWVDSQFSGVSFTPTTRWRHLAVEVSATGQETVDFAWRGGAEHLLYALVSVVQTLC